VSLTAFIAATVAPGSGSCKCPAALTCARRDQKQVIIDQFIAEDERNKTQLAHQNVQLRELALLAEAYRQIQDEVDVWRTKVRELMCAMLPSPCMCFIFPNVGAHTHTHTHTHAHAHAHTYAHTLRGQASESDRMQGEVQRLRERLEDADAAKARAEV
jgi:hypothetical protein